jgi:hypothetical protein
MYHTITHTATENESCVWAKQVIEEIAEPVLEHRDLGLGDWKRIGPIEPARVYRRAKLSENCPLWN